MRSIIKGVIAKVRAIEESAIHVKKGAFHAWLGKSPDQKITAADIAKGKAAGGHAAKMAEFAQNFGHIGEEVIDELSKRTLTNYIRRASHSAAAHGIDVGKYQGKVSKTGARPNGDADDSHTGSRYQDDIRKMFKRIHGISKASH